MNMKRFFIFAILVCILGFSVFAQDKTVISPFKMASARNAGMGGLHITNTDGVGALLYNPAGLVGKKEFGLFEVSVSTVNILDKLDTIIDSVSDLMNDPENTENIQNIYNTLVDDEGRVALGLNVGGPLALAFIGNGFGFGLFTGADVNLALAGGRVDVNAGVTAQLNLGYGHRFIDTERHSLDAGVGIHGFFRVDAISSLSMNDVAAVMEDPFSKLPVRGIWGLGIDLAVQYQYNKKLSVALAANDLFSYARIMDFADDFGITNTDDPDAPYVPFEDIDGSVYRGLNVGVQYQLFDTKILDFALMFDYRDILDLFADIPRNPLLNMGLGAELGLFDHIFIRAGVSDMLPALGVGFDLFAFKLDAAFYGRELGLDPGVQPVFCADISILFRW